MTLEELKVVITAETKGLERSISEVKSSLNSVSSSVDKMGSKVSKSVEKTSKSFDKLSTKVKGVFRSLLASAGFIAGIAGLIRLGKAALETASDLQEVQNVVDVSFGSASAEIDEFAKSAIKQFGLSELAAKQAASTFMAMGNGMNIAKSEGKKMAIELTKLAGDMASFYNTTKDVAQTALEGIYTGNALALKKFGIVMTEANLEAYRLSQGIKKSYSAMSQAEKVALRYNYVMATTAQVQGDFARTSGSWANQVKILKEQWRQLLGILGNVLIQVLLPMVKAMNNLLASAISVANALAKAFGFKGIQSASASVSSAAGGASDLESALGGASEQASALKKTLASFDELNVLNDASSSGLADLGGGVSAETIGLAETVEDETSYSTGKLKSFLDDCKDILLKWKATIPALEFNIDKDHILDELKDAGKNILNTIAGWGSFVITIGVKVANDLNLDVLITKAVELFNSLTNLTSAITDALVPALETLYDIVIRPLVRWLGDKLADAIDFVKQKFDQWAQWFRDNKETIGQFAENLGKVLEPLIQIVLKIADGAWVVFKTVLEGINTALMGIADTIINLDLDKLTAIRNIFLFFFVFLGGTALANAIIGFKGLWAAIESGYGIFPYLADLIKMPFQLLLGNLAFCGKRIALFFTTLIKELGVAFATIKGAVIAALGAIKTALSSAIAWIIANPMALIIAGIVALVVLIAIKGDEIKKLLEKLDAWLQGVFAKDWTEVFGPILGGILNGFFDFIKEIWDAIKKNLTGWIDFIRGVFTADWTRAWNGLKDIFGGAFEGMKALARAPLNAIIDMVNGVIRGLNKIKLPDWDILGGLRGKAISLPTIPRLAKGAVITAPTLALMGEYANAASNPEIVAPQSVLQSTINASNEDLISTLIQLNKQLITAIENKDTTVNITDDAIANSVMRSNQGSIKRTGKALLSY